MGHVVLRLQLAPDGRLRAAPALKAICAIYATDDRWTDDVHWRGGALRLVDLVDYCHYMTPMNVLPPVPAVWGDGWAEEWQRRLDTSEPWVLTWLREDRHGDYWRTGRCGSDADDAGYERIECPTMLVAGWADGYRNNTFRTVRGSPTPGCRTGCSPGPWAHADPTTAMPGPRIDFDAELAGWFDHWLRGVGDHADGCDVFVPEPPRVPSPTSTCTRAGGRGCRRCRRRPPRRWCSTDRGRSASCSPTSAPPPGSTAPGTCPGGSPTTSASTTPGP